MDTFDAFSNKFILYLVGGFNPIFYHCLCCAGSALGIDMQGMHQQQIIHDSLFGLQCDP